MEKSEIRAEMKRRCAATTADGTEAPRLWSRLELTPEFSQSRTVLVYMSLPDEVPTPYFIARWRAQKRFVLPLVNGNSLLLKEYSPELLVEGYAGIMEPEAQAADVAPEDIDLAIIPGQAFTPEGGRLGRGKGFYDRLLPRLSCPLFGVAWGWRMVPELPCGPQDVAMDAVFTPDRVYRREKT